MTELLERKAAYRRGASSKAKLLGIQGVAALLDRSPDSARELLKLPGAPKALNMPGDARWRECDIEDWLESLK